MADRIDFAHRGRASHQLEQGSTAHPAADAGGGHPMAGLEAPHHMDEGKGDAVAAGPDRVAKADGAPVDIEDVHRDRADRLVKPENAAAELPLVERALAGEH